MKLIITSVRIEIEGEVKDVLAQRDHFAGVLGFNGHEQAAAALADPALPAGSAVQTPIASTPPVSTKAPAPRPAGEIEWTRYPVRTALAEHGPCVICHRLILKKDTYYDGNNAARRVHVACVADQPAKASA